MRSCATLRLKSLVAPAVMFQPMPSSFFALSWKRRTSLLRTSSLMSSMLSALFPKKELSSTVFFSSTTPKLPVTGPFSSTVLVVSPSTEEVWVPVCGIIKMIATAPNSNKPGNARHSSNLARLKSLDSSSVNLFSVYLLVIAALSAKRTPTPTNTPISLVSVSLATLSSLVLAAFLQTLAKRIPRCKLFSRKVCSLTLNLASSVTRVIQTLLELRFLVMLLDVAVFFLHLLDSKLSVVPLLLLQKLRPNFLLLFLLLLLLLFAVVERKSLTIPTRALLNRLLLEFSLHHLLLVLFLLLLSVSSLLLLLFLLLLLTVAILMLQLTRNVSGLRLRILDRIRRRIFSAPGFPLPTLGTKRE